MFADFVAPAYRARAAPTRRRRSPRAPRALLAVPRVPAVADLPADGPALPGQPFRLIIIYGVLGAAFCPSSPTLIWLLNSSRTPGNGATAAEQRDAGHRGPAVPGPVREADLGPAVGGLLLGGRRRTNDQQPPPPSRPRLRPDPAAVRGRAATTRPAPRTRRTAPYARPRDASGPAGPDSCRRQTQRRSSSTRPASPSSRPATEFRWPEIRASTTGRAPTARR